MSEPPCHSLTSSSVHSCRARKREKEIKQEAGWRKLSGLRGAKMSCFIFLPASIQHLPITSAAAAAAAARLVSDVTSHSSGKGCRQNMSLFSLPEIKAQTGVITEGPRFLFFIKALSTSPFTATCIFNLQTHLVSYPEEG